MPPHTLLKPSCSPRVPPCRSGHRGPIQKNTQKTGHPGAKAGLGWPSRGQGQPWSAIAEDLKRTLENGMKKVLTKGLKN